MSGEGAARHESAELDVSKHFFTPRQWSASSSSISLSSSSSDTVNACQCLLFLCSMCRSFWRLRALPPVELSASSMDWLAPSLDDAAGGVEGLKATRTDGDEGGWQLEPLASCMIYMISYYKILPVCPVSARGASLSAQWPRASPHGRYMNMYSVGKCALSVIRN